MLPVRIPRVAAVRIPRVAAGIVPHVAAVRIPRVGAGMVPHVAAVRSRMVLQRRLKLTTYMAMSQSNEVRGPSVSVLSPRRRD